MNVDFGTNDIDEILSIIKVFRSNEKEKALKY